jgi:NAD(P)-dependent dehydrogenase (short-subunit alcohol dehydrogenase family)
MIDYKKKFSLKGKTAVVTGGLGLLGREIIEAVAQFEGRAIIADIKNVDGDTLREQLKLKGYKVEYEYFDISDIENIEKKVSEVFNTYHNISGWVNAAYPQTLDWKDKRKKLSDRWYENVNMQMNSYCLTSWYVANLMKDKHLGSIINIGSIYGIVGNDFTIYEGTDKSPPPEYAAIKGGIVNFSRYLASKFGSFGVRVNTVCPGGIYNEQKDKRFIENYSNRTLIKRMGRADEISPGVVFLLSDASSYITGSNLIIDGGWTAI